MTEKPYKTIVSDADFIDIIKNNSIKLGNIKKAYIKPVSFEFTFLEKNPEIQTETEKYFLTHSLAVVRDTGITER